MKNTEATNWDEEMQVRVYGAAPADDYNFKTKVYPKYSTEAERARELVSHINESGKYRVNVSSRNGQHLAEVYSADGAERLSRVDNAAEAAAICRAIVTADVRL